MPDFEVVLIDGLSAKFGPHVSSPVASFAFEDLFQSSEPGVVFDIHPARLWQDSARTVAVTADGDPVACIDDTSGNANNALQITAGKRPLYRTDGTLHWLEPDGVDDCMVTAGINAGGATKATIFAAGGDGTQSFAILANYGYPVDGDFYLYTPNNLKFVSEIGIQNGANAVVTENSTNTSAVRVVTVQIDYSATTTTDQILCRVNGAAQALSIIAGPSGAGSFANHALDLFALGGSSAFYAGKLFGLVVRFAQSTPDEIASAESLIAQRAGVTLP